jgi:methionyl-tRNA formyltransferase
MAGSKIKVIFIGTPLFAVPSLEYLIADDDIQVQAIVTQEDKKVGRRQIQTPPPVKELALKHDIPVIQPPSLKNNREAMDLIRELKPDFLVVVAFGQILPPELLKIPKYCCINLHGSLLPKYRGASPIEEAILNGNTETGITFIKMDEKLDNGDILLLQRIKINPNDTALTMRAKMSMLGGSLLPFLLKDYVQGQLIPIRQNDANATYCRKIKKEDGLIDLYKMSANQIVNRIRAYTPWPSCFLSLNGKKLKILEAATDESLSKKFSAKPGEAIIIDKETLALATASGLLIPKTIQLEGKKPMKIQDFLRGNGSFFK